MEVGTEVDRRHLTHRSRQPLAALVHHLRL